MRDTRFLDLRTVPEIRGLFRFSSDNAVRLWIRRHAVPVLRRGRVLLIDTRDVEAAMTHDRQSTRRFA